MLGEEYEDEDEIEYRGLVVAMNDDTGEAQVLPIADQPMFEGESNEAILDVLNDIAHDIQHLYKQQLAKTYKLEKTVDVIVN